MNENDVEKMQPELDRMLADHERFVRLLAQSPAASDEQRRAIEAANSPEGWRRAMNEVLAQTALRPTKGRAMRTFGIWVFGLLASMIIGGIIGSRFDTGYSNDLGFWGCVAGLLTFACIRLWLGQSKISN